MDDIYPLVFSGELPEHFERAFAELAPLLGFTAGSVGTPVWVNRGAGPGVHMRRGQVRITWKKPVHLYRALSLLRGSWGQETLDTGESPCFETGVLLDCSRNAVRKPGFLRELLRRMALMGIDLAMLYTEDTYEVPGEPYIGYMRGRYTQAELRQLDDYANLFGIELCPCIQTLGHLGRLLHWPAMEQYRENGEVLLADEEETYALLRRMIEAASRPYRSRRIHIGMDEAHGVGLGAHLQKHGYEDPFDILHRHLLRVKAITDELGLAPMMWSDMYFRLGSEANGYYDAEPVQKALERVVPGIRLVYWDYQHESEGDYALMLRRHRQLGRDFIFAGGIWAWAGPAPDYVKTFDTAAAALAACKKAGVPLVLAAAWADDGAEAHPYTLLPGLQFYAEFAYTGGHDAIWLQRRFEVCCGARLHTFLDLGLFNRPPGMRSGPQRPVNAAKFLLYQDPLVQLFAKDVAGYALERHYAQLAQRYAYYAEKGGPYTDLMRFYEQLARVLAGKCHWHQNIAGAVQGGDREAARALAGTLPALSGDVDRLRGQWRGLWQGANKPYGFEILDGRMGALCARLDTARQRVLAWAEGERGEALEELFEEVLPYTLLDGGALWGGYSMAEIVSACKIDL